MEQNKYARPAKNILISGQEKIPVMICVDRSGSMHEEIPGLGKTKLELAYDCIMKHFIEQILASGSFKYKVDLAVVTFGNDAKVIKRFAPITDMNANKTIIHITDSYGAGMESGHLIDGIDKCLELLDRQKQYYRENEVKRKAAWLVILSDGKPSEDGSTRVMSSKAYKGMVDELHECEEKSHMNIIPVCFYEMNGDYKEDKGYKFLCSLSKTTEEGQTIPVIKKGNAAADFQKFFRNLSSSVRAGSKNVLIKNTSSKANSSSSESSIHSEGVNEIIREAEPIIVKTKNEDVEIKENKIEQIVPENKEQENLNASSSGFGEPKFIVYANSEKAKVSRFIVSGQYLAGYFLLASSVGQVLEVERVGFGKLQFEDSSSSFTIKERGKYEIYITNQNRVVVVLKESYEPKQKTLKVEQKQSSNVGKADPFEGIDDIAETNLFEIKK